MLCTHVVLSQTPAAYKPIPVTDTIPPSIYRELKAKNESDKMNVAVKGKTGNYLKSLYDQRLTYQVGMFNRDLILLNDDITGFLQSVQKNIYDANPELVAETTVYPYRSETPNALSMGNGTLCFMLGLLARLETEDEVAFVLCHELAHHHRKHTERKMAQLAEANYDKELKKKIDGIMSSPYNRYSKLKELFSSLDISFSKHSRFAEFEADSAGLVYYLNTRYNRLAPLRVMQILDKADSSQYSENIDLKKVFSFAEYPFKESWIDYRKSETWHAPLKNSQSDTARTHPSCMLRFDALKLYLKVDQVSHEQLIQGIPIDGMRLKAEFETIHSQYHFKQYGKALFNALLLAERHPKEVYLHAMIGKSLYKLYQAQKEHQLGKVLELPDSRFPENYDRFLTFIHKLRLSELAALAYHYVTTRPMSYYENEEFVHALWMCSRLDMSKMDSFKVRQEYEAMFPDGKYLDEMKKY